MDKITNNETILSFGLITTDLKFTNNTNLGFQLTNDDFKFINKGDTLGFELKSYHKLYK